MAVSKIFSKVSRNFGYFPLIAFLPDSFILSSESLSPRYQDIPSYNERPQNSTELDSISRILSLLEYLRITGCLFTIPYHFPFLFCHLNVCPQLSVLSRLKETCTGILSLKIESTVISHQLPLIMN
ncbi:MAG TPA: hypothetical protein PK466_07350 [Thermotogota bacterium]|nr:hypothetical protein [Thermotogota bacterium]HPJ89102.1 hypothetical protein [Thermotogota bacterium]HPR96129.1 hypothetical protein [Thermotogota bacterium]